MSSTAPAAPAAPAATDWREDWAYALGLQAYAFGFPYVYLPALRWAWVAAPPRPGGGQPNAPLNRFHHVRKLTDATYRDGGSPNNDTLYSIAWVDVRDEPVILSHPDMGDRYFTFQISGIDSDNFAYVGSRTTGSGAGAFAIVGPDWRGTLPDGVTALPPSRSRSVLVMGRTLVDGPADVAAVAALQDRYALTPLGARGRADAAPSERRDVWPPSDPKSDPLADWKTMNRAMTEDPPESRLAPLLAQFASIGIGPGQDVERTDPSTRRGLARAAAEGRRLLKRAIESGELGVRMNGWNVPPRCYGRAGLADAFLVRGALQCMGGIVAHDPEEGMYFNTSLDGTGAPLDGARRYVLRFAPGGLPDVRAFWSITVYDPTFNLVANPIDRYSIGDRTPGLARDGDGGLTLHLQADAPAAPRDANWLPVPKSGPFFVVMRTYVPGPDIVEQRWAPPAIVEAGR